MRTKALDFPKSILIETTNLCQGKCIFCPYSKLRRNHQKELLNIDYIKKIIDEISHYDIKRITLFNNNEPLLDDRIYEIINYTHHILPDTKITLSTNGRLLTKEIINKLYNNGLTVLYISIPTLDPIKYQTLMSYDIGNILKTLNEINNNELNGMIRIAVPITNFFNHDEFDKYFTPRNIIFRSWPMEYKDNWNIKEEISKIATFDEYIGPCDRPMDQAVVLYNGNVVICCRDWLEENIIGNIKDNTLYEIWHSDKMKMIQQKIAEMKYDDIECCKECNLNENFYKRMVKK